MRSQGPEKVRSWNLPRELQGLQESFCREGVLHQGGELHNEPGSEVSDEIKSVPGSLEGGTERRSETSTSGAISIPSRSEGSGNPERLCDEEFEAAEAEEIGNTLSAFNLPVTDTLGSQDIFDPVGGEWAWEDFFSESAFAECTLSESHGRPEKL